VLNSPEQDNLTKLEKRVYRYVARLALCASVYLMVLIKVGSLSPNHWTNTTGFMMLTIAAVFGWGRNKNVRVLDLRRFTRE
jgi:di/tricarboxylate transporter